MNLLGLNLFKNEFIELSELEDFWLHHAACGILVPTPGIKAVPPAVEAQSLNHWTAREVPLESNFKILFCIKTSLIYYYFSLFFFVIYLFIYLFLAVLSLLCCVWAFSSCGERGLLFFVVRGLLIAVAPLVAEHGVLRVQASLVVARGL